MTPKPLKLSPRDIDHALNDHYQHLLDLPVPARFDRLLKQLRSEQKVLEPKD